MKRILYTLCAGTLALAVTAWGEDSNNHSNKESAAPAGGRPARTASVRSTNHVSTVRSGTYHVNRPSVSRGVTYHSNTVRNTGMTTLRQRNLQTNNRIRERSHVAVNRSRNSTVNRDRNVAVNHNRNVTINRDRNFNVNRNRNVVVNNNWRGARFNGRAYAAFRAYHRQWHDRFWWRSHFNRIVFVSGGGWYYWNAGYWFPAWGYDPYYSYPYDGPIYGYNGMAPDQVIVDVQSQLLRDGYYNGPVDGVLGPNTRAAIASFQADHGLAITSAVDEPTLDSLGIS